MVRVITGSSPEFLSRGLLLKSRRSFRVGFRYWWHSFAGVFTSSLSGSSALLRRGLLLVFHRSLLRLFSLVCYFSRLSVLCLRWVVGSRGGVRWDVVLDSMVLDLVLCGFGFGWEMTCCGEVSLYLVDLNCAGVDCFGGGLRAETHLP
ncbi:hypothetical protein A2U01_0031217, partial [Trifolium medium]|nr:hypothetical protein [Trifolium medium]